jgi:DNA polymerase-3 subunit delta'
MPEEVNLASFLPQGTVIRSLLKSLSDGTYVHAYLISGAPGFGKRTLAGLVARYLLCTGNNRPCGVCEACRQVMAGTHPDLLRIRPGRRISSDMETETGKTVIQVATIREVIQRVSTHAYEGRAKVVLIEEAEKMNPQAQNALLKTLEEPPDDTIFLLLTSTTSALLPTIISRCRHIPLHAWKPDMIAYELNRRGISQDRVRKIAYLSEGSIGKALEIAENEEFWQYRQSVIKDFLDCPDRTSAFLLAAAWKDRKGEAGPLFDQLEDLMRTLTLVHFGQLDSEALSDYPEPWKRLAGEAEDHALLHLLDAVSAARYAWQSQMNFQAVLETMMLRFMEEKTKW